MSGTTAWADDITRASPTPEERSAVERCANERRTAAEQRSCIGMVSGPCRDTQDGATTLGSAACYGRELGAWDGLLNRSYRDAMATFDDAGRTYLRGAQTAWLRFRDQACGWSYQVYPGGSIAGPLSGECLMRQTALRALDLLEVRNALKER